MEKEDQDRVTQNWLRVVQIPFVVNGGAIPAEASK
jgi:hypothetical protein